MLKPVHMEVQQAIRRNAEEALSYKQDLLKWQEEQAQADRQRRQKPSSLIESSANPLAPVRWLHTQWSFLITESLHV